MDADKKEVAFEVMEHVDSLSPKDNFGAQWHVGHHDWSFDKAKQLALDTDDIPHNDTNYEEKVNAALRKVEIDIVKDKSTCEPDDNGERGRKVLKKLDQLSSRIRTGVRGWNKYYVSAMSYVYAKEAK